jgi:hypothetical protein
MVTDVWAGLLLVHFLSHLQDAMRGDPRTDLSHEQMLQGEVPIYWRELAAADLLAQGRLRPALDSLIGRWQPVSVLDLAERADTLDLTDVRYLNSTLPGDGALSEAELVDRASFFAPALLIRFAEGHQVPLPALLGALDHLALANERR